MVKENLRQSGLWFKPKAVCRILKLLFHKRFSRFGYVFTTKKRNQITVGDA